MDIIVTQYFVKLGRHIIINKYGEGSIMARTDPTFIMKHKAYSMKLSTSKINEVYPKTMFIIRQYSRRALHLIPGPYIVFS